jgi:uncharacterized protein YbjT (DUF2867 family)
MVSDSPAEPLPRCIVIRGAFSFTGKHAALELLRRGHSLRTLTNHPDCPSIFSSPIPAFPYAFDRPDQLVESLRGADVLVNTYWVRFPRRGLTYETAIENSLILFRAAKDAGIKRIVHVSVTNASLDSPLPYYRGKARLEQIVADSGLSYSVIRPSLIFENGDILLNNIAWFLRRFPVFGIPGDGQYRVQPVSAQDVAAQIAGAVQSQSNGIVDAVGPDIFTFQEMVGLIAAAIGVRFRPVRLSPSLACFFTRAVGWCVRDTVLTREEYRGLMSNLLLSRGVPQGKVHFAAWLRGNCQALGRRYASELDRHFRNP